jgi:hypothetical protein
MYGKSCFCRSHGVDTAVVQVQTRTTIVPRVPRRKSFSLEPLIETMIGEQGADFDLVRPRALFDFIGYMRFPRKRNAIRDASSLCAAKYVCEFVSRDERGRTLTRLEQCELLMKFANPVSLIDLCLSERIFDFHFEDFHDQGFTRTVADIVRFLISYDPGNTRFRDQASVKKAHFFFANTRGFAKNQDLSWRRFSTIWGEFKGVAAFIYVNEYHFKRRMIFDPAPPDFFDRIQLLLADRTGLLRFFRQSLFVSNELVRRLDKRTWGSHDIPRFPQSLTPLAVANAPIDQESMRIMGEYGQI